MPRRIEVYRDRAGGWRFRVRAANSQIVAVGEAYTRAWSAERGARRQFPGVEVRRV